MEPAASPSSPSGGHVHEAGEPCPQCLVDPKRSRSSLVAWIIAAVAVAVALVAVLARPGSLGFDIAGVSAVGLLVVLLCPLMMGAMMFMMMRSHHH